jgi:hypothetical protein
MAPNYINRNVVILHVAWPMSITMKKNLALGAAGLWLFLAIAGSAVLAKYAASPSAGGEPAPYWPPQTALTAAKGGFTLVVLAHPQCGCSRATMEELAQLLAHSRVRLQVHVVFLRPAGMPAGWERSALWSSAEAIPGVRVWSDPDGREIEQFGGWTSGQALLYDSDGRLRFSGGITEARGHVGDNYARDALENALRPGSRGFAKAPVFGCSLRRPHANG